MCIRDRKYLGMGNRPEDKVKVIFVPCYQDGHDGILNLSLIHISMFAFATGKVIESFYRYNLTETDKVVVQAHEWMTGMAALYLQSAVPEIGTIFTTWASLPFTVANSSYPTPVAFSEHVAFVI